jgi:hypothetical protein
MDIRRKSRRQKLVSNMESPYKKKNISMDCSSKMQIQDLLRKYKQK